MDNFDFKKYLKEGRINKDFSQLDEKKQDSKKGNKEEQKRMEGSIRDNEIHIDKLNKDKKADEKKLAKLKKDFKKDVNESSEISEKQGYNDRDDEAIGAKDGAEKDKKVSMKGRRDMSRGMEKAMGKRADSTDSKMDESALAAGAGVAAIFGGAAALDKIMDKLEDGDLGEGGKKVAAFLRSQGKAAAGRYNEGKEIEVKEDARTDAEQEGYKDGFDDAKDDMKDAMSKMKVSELKAKIRETILAELTLDEGGFEASDAGSQYHDSLYTEEEDVDVDVDFEDEVNVDAEGDDIEIEKPAVKAKVQVGLSPEETIVQDSLKAAMDAADALGNDKLADQIGNTITFFTREYVVGRNSD
ncbi:hypothetical protein N9L94_06435 [Robiginitalea sp.]|nr:hypothetical protein [Robiginitalea sp.]